MALINMRVQSEKLMSSVDQVVRAQNGDVAAFTELVKRHQNLVLGFAFNRLGDFHRAQDIVQETFVIAHANLGKLKDPEAFSFWLRGIALNCCRRTIRQNASNWVCLDQYQELEADGPSPEAETAQHQSDTKLRAAIADLSPQHRDIITLYYLEERSQKEVADFLGLSVTKVNNALHASRQNLKGALSDMAKDQTGKMKLDDAFAEELGKIVRVEGRFVEAEVGDGDMPRVLDLLGSDGAGEGEVLVIQRLTDSSYRGIKTAGDVNESDQLTFKADPFNAVQSMTEDLVKDLVASKSAKQVGRLLETGIKVIDLMTPLTDGATLGNFGGSGVGRAVLLGELIERRNNIQGSLQSFFYLHHWDALGMRGTPLEDAPALDVYPNFENSFVLHRRGNDPVYAAGADYLDARLYFSPIKAWKGEWPAIDPLHSTSKFLSKEVLQTRHFDVATAVRETLQQAHDLMADARFYELVALGAAREALDYFKDMRREKLKSLTDEEQSIVRRAERLDAFFAQPFIIAAEYTGKLGETVPLSATLDGAEAILSGDHDETPVSDIAFRGAL